VLGGNARGGSAENDCSVNQVVIPSTLLRSDARFLGIEAQLGRLGEAHLVIRHLGRDRVALQRAEHAAGMLSELERALNSRHGVVATGLGARAWLPTIASLRCATANAIRRKRQGDCRAHTLCSHIDAGMSLAG
jgi:hypothetical protein